MLFILFLKILQLWKIREIFNGMKKGIFTAFWISRKKNELCISLQSYYGLAKEFWEIIAHNFYGYVLSFQTFPLQLQSQCSKAESDEADHDGAGAGGDLYPECCPHHVMQLVTLTGGAALTGFLSEILPLHLSQLCQQ